MKWMTTFATSLPGRLRVNDFHLLYTGNNHYDCILDAVFHSRHLGSFHDSHTVVNIHESSSNMQTGVAPMDGAVAVKRRKMCYQSIIGTRRGCNKPSRLEPQAVFTRVNFRSRAILATKRLLASSLPFKYYGESRRFRGSLPHCLRVPGTSDSASDAILYCDTFDTSTKYMVCAICGFEGSRVSCVPVADVGDLLDKSGIASKFNNMICPDRVNQLIKFLW